MELLIYESNLIGLLRKTGVRTQTLSFDSSFLFIQICRIRGPPFRFEEILNRTPNDSFT